ncbi:hypothetical protein C9374_014527 [Naegleria lovaniensis]|uniref:YrhK domain-containing protein n=1 Tax=Naegleria lovaniensis TaxID=51637 RepID=A0AA88KUC1_NAELO|nr:uncharacterized protein C9374_014527 [Naegleria lovaniensis]KAG2389127.1 hypothetical protein C9374_014527 [Naegleria lovaniensis]
MSTPDNTESNYNVSSNSITKIDINDDDHQHSVTISSSTNVHNSNSDNLDLVNGNFNQLQHNESVMQATNSNNITNNEATSLPTETQQPTTLLPIITETTSNTSKLTSPTQIIDVDVAATTTTGSSAKTVAKHFNSHHSPCIIEAQTLEIGLKTSSPNKHCLQRHSSTDFPSVSSKTCPEFHPDASFTDLYASVTTTHDSTTVVREHQTQNPYVHHRETDSLALPYLHSFHSTSSEHNLLSSFQMAHTKPTSLGVNQRHKDAAHLPLNHHHPSSLISLKIHEKLQSQKNNLMLSHAMRIATSLAFAWMDITFVLGAALFVAGCGLLIASNEIYFFSGVLLFIIGSAMFLVGPVGKLVIDLYQLVRHFRWETKLKHLPTLYNVTEVVDDNHLHHYDSDQNNSSKSSIEYGHGRNVDQLVDLQHEFRKYRPEDLPSLKMILLELFNDTLLLLGGLTFTIGSSLYMLNPPLYVVYIAEVCWAVGAISYLIVTIIQYALKQMDIIKNYSKSYEVITFKCFTIMTLDISSYLFNILSSVLFVIGAGCFLVNQRSLEITGEVIWSGGCISMIIAIFFSRIVWLKNTFCFAETDV